MVDAIKETTKLSGTQTLCIVIHSPAHSIRQSNERCCNSLQALPHLQRDELVIRWKNATSRTGHASKADPELLKGNHVAATRANTDEQWQRKLEEQQLWSSALEPRCLSFVSMSIRGLIKEIVHAHSLTCIASVDELTPPYFLLSSTTGENKMGNWLVFGLCSYPCLG